MDTIMTFEFNPQHDIETSDPQQAWGEGLIKELNLEGHESILDLGCGDGRLTALLARQVPAGCVIGIDASQQMTAAARELHRRQTNVSFRTLDINHLCCENEFDVVFSNAALHWVHDHKQLMTNVHRALKAQGLIRFNYAGKGHCVGLMEILTRIMTEPEFAPLFADFLWPWNMATVKDTSELVVDAGFNGVKVWKETEEARFLDQDTLISWMDHLSLDPFLAAIKNRQTAQRFRDRIVEHMIQEMRQSNDTFVEASCRLNVQAQKKTTS
jgi:trans-aconitate 2-methyltransferase